MKKFFRFALVFGLALAMGQGPVFAQGFDFEFGTGGGGFGGGFPGFPGGGGGFPGFPGGGGFPGFPGGGGGFPGFPGGGGFPGFPGGFGGGGVASAGASGVQRRDTDRTGAQAWQDITPGNMSAFPGQTFRTGRGTLNAGDFNGPALPDASVGELGMRTTFNSSVGYGKPIPSGEYTFGFGGPATFQEPGGGPGGGFGDYFPEDIFHGGATGGFPGFPGGGGFPGMPGGGGFPGMPGGGFPGFPGGGGGGFPGGGGGGVGFTFPF